MMNIEDKSRALFEHYKDHRVVKALITFLDWQRKQLHDVSAWSCDLEKVDSNNFSGLTFYEYDVLFTDDSGFRGTIVQLDDDTPVVHSFRVYTISSGDRE